MKKGGFWMNNGGFSMEKRGFHENLILLCEPPFLFCNTPLQKKLQMFSVKRKYLKMIQSASKMLRIWNLQKTKHDTPWKKPVVARNCSKLIKKRPKPNTQKKKRIIYIFGPKPATTFFFPFGNHIVRGNWRFRRGEMALFVFWLIFFGHIFLGQIAIFF